MTTAHKPEPLGPNGWPRVWLLDHDGAMCAALERLLRATAIEVEVFEDRASILEQLEQRPPNCMVLRLGPRDRLGLELLERAQGPGEQLAIVLVSRATDVVSSVRAMKGGAVDVLEQPVDLGALLAAVVRGLARDAEWREARSRMADVTQKLEVLTPREREVFELVATGKPNKRIAVELGTSEKTIKVHRGRVMHKLQASSVVDLVHLSDQSRCFRPERRGSRQAAQQEAQVSPERKTVWRRVKTAKAKAEAHQAK